MLIKFPLTSRLSGYKSAQILSEKLNQYWTTVGGDSLVPVLPKFVPVEEFRNSPSGGENTKWVSRNDNSPIDLAVTMTLLPLEKYLRNSIASASGRYISPSEAFDLDQIHLSDLQNTGGTDLHKTISADISNARCQGALIRAQGRLNGQEVSVYTQYVSDSQKPIVALAKQVLKRAGFADKPAEKVDIVPDSGQVRICANYDSSYAEMVTDIANACLFGTYETKPLPPCQSPDPGQAVELWLARPHPQMHRVCVGNGGGESCAASADTRLSCAEYSSNGGGSQRTLQWLGKLVCDSPRSDDGKPTPYRVIHELSAGGGQCGWTSFTVICDPS